jgi:Vam6/Vps39-like protein vacuolar protein sorting-associated protein 39
VQSIFEGSKAAVQQINNRMKLLTVKGDHIYVATARDIWRLVPVPLVDQIDELVRIKSYDEALSLLNNLPAQNGTEETKTEQMKHVRYLCANHLFEKGQYDEAMKLFQELNCNPLKVLRLFPNMLPRHLQEPGVLKIGTSTFLSTW